MVLSWILLGGIGYVGYVIVPLTVLLLLKKEMFEELILGFFFILLISDSFFPPFAFAKEVKNIYVVILLIYFLFRTNEFYPLNNLYKLFALFFLVSLWTIISSAGEPYFITGLQKTISYFIAFIIVPNYLQKIFREKREEFLKNFIYFCFVTLLTGFVLIFVAPDIAYLSGGRYRGIMGNPNGIGIYSFLVGIIFGLINDFFPDLFSKREKISIYAVIILSILMSESRGALVAILIFYLNGKAFKYNLFLGFIVFIVFVIISYFINTNIVQIITSLGLQEYLRVDTLKDASGRYVAWEFAWRQIQYNFFIGKGFGYDEYFMFRHFDELSKLGHQGGVHNSFLSFWMTQGLIGLLVYLRAFILIFIKASRKTRSAFPIMFAISFTAFFESWLLASLSAYAFIGLFIFTLISSEEIKVEESSEELVPN